MDEQPPALPAPGSLYPGFDPERAPSGHPWRRAAVLFLLYERDAVVYTCFTQRTATVATHRGQISLPGGAHEPHDATLVETALRETFEEVGIPPEAVEVLVELEPEYVAVSGFLVTPVIGRLAAPPSFHPDPREVERVIEVPVAVLLDPASQRIEDRGTYVRQSPVYQYGEHEIWGATARMLSRILAHPHHLPGLAVPE
ncbi:MAG TPA: CoA pyrophosphatase [Chloroflexota bacterium]|nr:CoA pyrophosphatase [Chloroflexota bacterium]